MRQYFFPQRISHSVSAANSSFLLFLIPCDTDTSILLLLLLSLLFFQNERAYSFCGTIEYMAPDIVKGGEAGHDKVCFTLVYICQ